MKILRCVITQPHLHTLESITDVTERSVSFIKAINTTALHCQPYTVFEVYPNDTITSHQVLCSFNGFMHANNIKPNSHTYYSKAHRKK